MMGADAAERVVYGVNREHIDGDPPTLCGIFSTEAAAAAYAAEINKLPHYSAEVFPITVDDAPHSDERALPGYRVALLCDSGEFHSQDVLAVDFRHPAEPEIYLTDSTPRLLAAVSPISFDRALAAAQAEWRRLSDRGELAAIIAEDERRRRDARVLYSTMLNPRNERGLQQYVKRSLCAANVADFHGVEPFETLARDRHEIRATSSVSYERALEIAVAAWHYGPLPPDLTPSQAVQEVLRVREAPRRDA